MKKLILILFLLNLNSFGNLDLNNNNCCVGSSVIIFQKSDSKNKEIELKNVLTKLSIKYLDLKSQVWESKSSSVDVIRDSKLSRISIDSNSWASLSLHLNSTLINSISKELSKLNDSPVIAFLEYEQEAWGYCLYQNGTLIDNYWNNYLTLDFEKNDCKANIDLISNLFNVKKELIEPYLIDIFDKNDLGKVNIQDEFELNDHWVRVDFMKKIGLQYPYSGKWIYIYESGLNE